MRDHKSLLAWKVAHEVARAALRLCRTRWKPYGSALFEQLQRSALSVQLNIAEGHALRTPGRFRYHLGIAYASAVETGEVLELAMLEEILSTEEAQAVLERCRLSQYLLLGLLRRYRPPDRPRSHT